MNNNEQLKAIEEAMNKALDMVREAGEKAKREAMKEADGAWKPRCGDDYWCIFDDEGMAESCWHDDEIDKARYALGNCFPTKSAAEHARDCLRWQAAYKRKGRKFKTWECNWVAYWDHALKVIEGGKQVFCTYGLVCFDSKGELHAAIDATCLEMDGTHEDFARYVLGVEV